MSRKIVVIFCVIFNVHFFHQLPRVCQLDRLLYAKCMKCIFSQLYACCAPVWRVFCRVLQSEEWLYMCIHPLTNHVYWQGFPITCLPTATHNTLPTIESAHLCLSGIIKRKKIWANFHGGFCVSWLLHAVTPFGAHWRAATTTKKKACAQW